MQYRFYEGNPDEWQEENLEFTPDELRRRFLNNNTQDTTYNSEVDNLNVVGDEEKFVCGEPAYDIYDRTLAKAQFDAFLQYGKEAEEKEQK